MLGYGRVGYGIGHMAGGGLGIAGALFTFFVVALIAALVIWFVISRNKPASIATGFPGQAPTPEDGALEITRQRLARGEIDVEQYNAIATALRGE